MIARIVSLVLLALAGLIYGGEILELFPNLSQNLTLIRVISGVVGALVGFVIGPWISTRLFRRLRRIIQNVPIQILVSSIVGLFIGLAFGALTAYPLSLLPRPLGQFLPFAGAVLFGYTGVLVATMRTEVTHALRERFGAKTEECAEDEVIKVHPILLDTSVIIDGRIADICNTGFIRGELIVPLFVLNELQHIADSADTLRRNRGRRGLEILRHLQEDSPIPVRITDEDDESVREVDDKLITLARKLGGSILTNDYNLNRVAELQGVTVLNVNELANAVKTVLLPGETFSIHVLQAGKEIDQGVGYLDDGTMVVVEEGRPYIGETAMVVVSKVLQTAAGRMIFARPE